MRFSKVIDLIRYWPSDPRDSYNNYAPWYLICTRVVLYPFLRASCLLVASIIAIGWGKDEAKKFLEYVR